VAGTRVRPRGRSAGACPLLPLPRAGRGRRAHYTLLRDSAYRRTLSRMISEET
jgi:hypothetical protein